MLTFLVVGSLWFWLFLAAELVLLIAYVESEKPAVQFATPISIVTFIVLLELGGSVDIFGFINNNKLLTGLLILGYIALGAVWGVFKWWLFCRNEFDKYAAAKAKFLRKNGIVGQADTTIPESLRANWRKTIEESQRNYSPDDRISAEPPQVRDHKSKIIRWMTFWVVSVLWSLCHDFVSEVYQMVYHKISKVLQSMANRAFASQSADITEPDQPRQQW